MTESTDTTIARRRALLGLGLAGLGAAATLTAAGGAQAQATSAGPAPRKLSGKVAIVTGARANLGRAFAAALAADGADVVVHYHREETRDQALETARLVVAAGGRAELVSGDLGQKTNVRRLFDVAESRFGGVDIVVNNAGKIVKKPMHEVTEAELEACHGINARAVFFAMQEACTRMRDNGRMITVGTSLMGPTFTPNYSAYNGTKASIEEFTRAFSREQGARGITANIICPGALDTPFFHAQETPQSVAAISRFSAMGRLGMVRDVVPLVSFLASPEAIWVNGQTLWVNGANVTR